MLPNAYVALRQCVPGLRAFEARCWRRRETCTVSFPVVPLPPMAVIVPPLIPMEKYSFFPLYGAAAPEFARTNAMPPVPGGYRHSSPSIW
jgi:hypothetical protein